MIDIIQTPRKNEVFLNTAPINIIIDSLLGVGYYFKLLIYINDESDHYNEQVRTKIDKYRCEIDFRGAVAEIFNQEYKAPTQTGFTENTDLFKKVSLVIQEVSESTGETVNTLNLPDFYVINANQENNNIYDHLQLLSVYNNHIKVPADGVVTLPFFSKTTTTAKLIRNYAEIENTTITDCLGVYSFNLIVADYNLSEVDTVTLRLTDGDTTIDIPIVVCEAVSYEINQIVFKNNYNAWEHLYCFGEKKDKKTIERKSLPIDDKRNKNYKTISTPIYTVNTGDYHHNYDDAISGFLDSQFLYLCVSGELIEVSISNKNTTETKSKAFIYNTDLSLKNNHKPNLENSIQYTAPSSSLNIAVEGFENIPTEILRSVFLDSYNGVNPTGITFPYISSTAEISIVINGVASRLSANYEYPFAFFDKIIVTGEGFGTPFTSFKYNIANNDGNSNTASVSVNIDMYDPLNKPPVISLPGNVIVFNDASSKTIVSYVYEPDGDPYTVIWQQIGGGQITLSNQTTETLSLTNWIGVGEYEFQITATDNRGNQSVAKTKLIVMDYKVNIEASESAIKITGGKVGDSVKLRLFITYTPYPDGGYYSNGSSRTKKIYINGSKIFEQYYTRSTGGGGVDLNFLTETEVKEKTITINFSASSEVVIPIEKYTANTSNTNYKVFATVNAELYSFRGDIIPGADASKNFTIFHV